MAPKRLKTSSITNDNDGEEKRAGRSKNPREGRKRGKLKSLMDLPLDAVYEIFGYLDPVDILHLSRSSKALRKVLIHRSASFVWRACIRNLEGFPRCPNDLNEMQYANLAFSPHCHFCLRKGCTRIMWGVRVRCCSRCQDEHFLQRSSIAYKFQPYDPEQFMEPVEFGGSNPREKFYLRSDVDFFARQLELNEKANEKDRSRKLVAAREIALQEIRKHVKECAHWQDLKTQHRKRELDMIRDKRIGIITEKLTTLGWSLEIEFLVKECDFDHPLIRQAKALTEAGWNKIKDEMIKFMEDTRKKRISYGMECNIRKAGIILDQAVHHWAEEAHIKLHEA